MDTLGMDYMEHFVHASTCSGCDGAICKAIKVQIQHAQLDNCHDRFCEFCINLSKIVQIHAANCAVNGCQAFRCEIQKV